MYHFILWPMLAALPGAEPAVEADVVIQNATLCDGNGKPGVKGDLAIKGERIVGVGAFTLANKPKVIDGSGLIVAPGFIDLHTHSDFPLVAAATKYNRNYLVQGVTTVVTGNCGFGQTDTADFFSRLEKDGVGSNVIHQVPHGSIRDKVMGNTNRLPTAAELEKLEALVDKNMKDGAWGMATGLIYTPGTYANIEELIALAKVVSRHGGFYASHIRNEGTEVLSALDEALTIGREAKLPVHISHLKANGRQTWGKAGDEIALIEKARREGQSVTADQYPYIASSTSLSAIVVPPRFREGKQKDFIARLDDAEQGPLVRKAIEERLEGKEGAKSLRIANFGHNTAWNGKDLLALAEQEKKTPLEIVLEIERNGGAQVVHFSMSDEDVNLIMKQPWVATASDGSATEPAASVPHPRLYGCFARKIGKYALTDKNITLEHAIRSASGLPADILHLPDRGYLKAGYYADVVVFDPETYRDTATFDKPHQYATGVRHLFVNGKHVIVDGKLQDVLAGKALRHPEKKE